MVFVFSLFLFYYFKYTCSLPECSIIRSSWDAISLIHCFRKLLLMVNFSLYGLPFPLVIYFPLGILYRLSFWNYPTERFYFLLVLPGSLKVSPVWDLFFIYLLIFWLGIAAWCGWCKSNSKLSPGANLVFWFLMGDQEERDKLYCSVSGLMGEFF